MPEKDTQYNQFIISEVFPSPEALLHLDYPSINELKKNALFVLDANTMLAPFLVGKDSLRDVEKAFRTLKKNKRLFLPEQAIREYARHRTSKIAEAYGHIQQRLSELPSSLKMMEISMYEEVPEYKSAVESAEAVRKSVKIYKTHLSELQEIIRNWNYDDPVSKLYANIFTADQIITHDKKQEELSTDLEHRVLHNIPPGYKDKNKPDGGIGDVIIWHTILKLGRDKKKHIVFVTNDGKTDWMVKYDQEALFPRFELVHEFYRATGQHFTIMRFDRFLKTMGADTTTVEEVRSARTKIFGFYVDKPNTLQDVICALEDVINEYLNMWSWEYNETDFSLEGNFQSLADRLLDLLHNNTVKLPCVKFNFVQTVIKVLTEMEELNSYIKYQSLRMKVSTNKEQEKLRELATQCLELLIQLKPSKF